MSDKNEIALSKLAENITKSLLAAVKSSEPDDYNSYEVKAVVKQFLESVYLIQNSKNIDVVVGRYEHLNRLVYTLQSGAFDERYSLDMAIALDAYKTSHYDKTPSEEQLLIIQEPSRENLKKITAPALKGCCDNFYNELLELSKTMKSKKAVYKRLIKALPLLYSARLRMHTDDDFEAIIKMHDSIDLMACELDKEYGYSDEI